MRKFVMLSVLVVMVWGLGSTVTQAQQPAEPCSLSDGQYWKQEVDGEGNPVGDPQFFGVQGNQINPWIYALGMYTMGPLTQNLPDFRYLSDEEVGMRPFWLEGAIVWRYCRTVAWVTVFMDGTYTEECVIADAVTGEVLRTLTRQGYYGSAA